LARHIETVAWVTPARAAMVFMVIGLPGTPRGGGVGKSAVTSLAAVGWSDAVFAPLLGCSKPRFMDILGLTRGNRWRPNYAFRAVRPLHPNDDIRQLAGYSGQDANQGKPLAAGNIYGAGRHVPASPGGGNGIDAFRSGLCQSLRLRPYSSSRPLRVFPSLVGSACAGGAWRSARFFNTKSGSENIFVIGGFRLGNSLQNAAEAGFFEPARVEEN
jgi:hypothetical protein